MTKQCFFRISTEQELNSQRRETPLFSSTSMAENHQFRIPAEQNFLPLKATRFKKTLQKRGRKYRKELVTSRCHGRKISRYQQTVVMQTWHGRKIKKKEKIIDMYDLPVYDCIQEKNVSPYFSSIVLKSNARLCQGRLLTSTNLATMVN